VERPFPAYDGNGPYIFVCYAHADAAQVYPELEWLRDAGTNIWYDEGISPGREFPEALAQAIIGADALLFYVSPTSVASRHCRDEVYLATELPPGLALSTGTTQALMRWELSPERYREQLQAALRGSTSESPSPRRRLRPRRIARRAAGVAVAIAVVGLLYVGVERWLEHERAVRWARSQLPELQHLLDGNWRDSTEAFALGEQLERHIPDDPHLVELMERASLFLDVSSEPVGAEVFMKPYRTPDAPWVLLGVTPIEDARVPIGVFRWKFEMPGYRTVTAAESTWNLAIGPAGSDAIVANEFTRTLDPIGAAPDDMVRVQGRTTSEGEIADFFIDRLEVTNAQYQTFVDAGGYANRTFWRHAFWRDGGRLDWADAMALLVDQTGRPGPATWAAGTYPDGRGNHPVNGVSWYEAAAYAEFVGRSLPTAVHWGLARGEYTPLIEWPQLGGYAMFAPFSNFTGDGPVEAGSLGGITPFGAVDMAGNVREWCFNATSAGRLVRGGSFGDPTYRFREFSQSRPFERSARHGFRTVLLPDLAVVPAAVFEPLDFAKAVDYYTLAPVDDDIFAVYRAQFDYDSTPLHPVVESRVETEHWTRERIGIDAAYGEERVILHLFLPRQSRPPYRTVVYVPGSGALFMPSSEPLDSYYEVGVFLSFLMKNGYAVLFPILKGSFERGGAGVAAMHQGEDTHKYSEWLRQLVKDLRRSIDYLEAREDIDSESLVYYGMSWGALVAPIALAVEDRFVAGMLIGIGFRGVHRPESNPIHYIGRVTLPLLMLHGRFDTLMPYETSAKPYFDLLGTPSAAKVLKLYDTDHIPPQNEFMKELLAWLERYQPPVSR
jgi:hypothetical protein